MLSRFCGFCPLVLLRCVIEHNIQHEVHILFLHGLLHGFQILQGAKTFINLSKIRYGIATITFCCRTLKHRHQV